MGFTIIGYSDWQGTLSPFYDTQSLPSDVQTQETKYHNQYLSWMKLPLPDSGNVLVENCMAGKTHCRVCINNGNCTYYTKATSENYDKYCISGYVFTKIYSDINFSFFVIAYLIIL